MTPRSRRRGAGPAHAREDGSILPLIAVFAALAAALVLVATAATSLYLERKRLYSLADGAALAGAESFSLDRVPGPGPSPRPRLSDSGVAEAAGEYLRASPDTRISDLRLEHAGTGDGRTATVTVSGWWRPPVLTVFVPDGVRLEVTATARGVFR